MKTCRIIEGLDYPENKREDPPSHHAITCEIIARVQQLDSILAGEGCSSGGVRLLHRLSTIHRRSPRAYRLLLDMLSSQRSLSESFEALASKHDHSRQSWLQNAQVDVELVSEVWEEVGAVMTELIKRRSSDDSIKENSKDTECCEAD